MLHAHAERWNWRPSSRPALGHVATILLLAACDTVGVRDAYTALDSNGNRKREVFYTDTQAIYCVVELASGVTDVTVVAKLRAKELYDPETGEGHAFDTIIGVEEQAPGAGPRLNIAFQLEKPDDAMFYPAGRFSCDLYVEGKREASLDFEVRYPDCPFYPIEADTQCIGQVLLGSECPGPLGERCTCDAESGNWSCE